MAGWNFAAVWDGIADAVPERLALVAGDRRATWAEFRDRAHHLAWFLHHRASLAPGDRVAIALGNCPEYLETFYAALTLRCVPVNVSPRSTTETARYLLDDSDALVVVHQPDLVKTIRTAARRIPRPWRPQLLEVGAPYEHAIAAAEPPTEPLPPAGGTDLVFLYTGNATGQPKAAMWRNDDLYRALTGRPSGVVLPVAPLTRGPGLFSAVAALTGSGTVVLLDSPRFDPMLVWGAVERERVETLAIVGDAFARPLLAALDAGEQSWDLSSLGTITSSGAVFSPDVKRRLVEHLPRVAIADSMSPSDALGSLAVNDRIAVLGEESMQPVLPGSDEVGLLAMTGFMPIGYWKDAARTATTFRVVDGTRYAIPGDYATVAADGSVHLVGRASTSVNTGGEKVAPGEIEARLGKHASVQDCAVVGVPGSGASEQLVALVVVAENHYIDEAELTAWCRTKLERHTAPQRFLFVDTLHRTASGKVNRHRLRDVAIEMLNDETRG